MIQNKHFNLAIYFLFILLEVLWFTWSFKNLPKNVVIRVPSTSFISTIPSKKHLSTSKGYNEIAIKLPSIRLYSQLAYELKNESSSSSSLLTIFDRRSSAIELSRLSIVQLIEKSWERVCDLIDFPILAVCEQELKGATSMLVLATH